MNNLLYADSEVEEIILTEASDLEINLKILEANVIGKAVLSDLDGVLSTPVSGICWVTSLETDSDDNSSDATPSSSSFPREFSVDFDESGIFALRIGAGEVQYYA